MKFLILVIILLTSQNGFASSYFDLYYEGRKAAEGSSNSKEFEKVAKSSCKEIKIYLSKHADKVAGLIQWDKEMFQQEVVSKGFKLNKPRDNLARVYLREKVTTMCSL